MKKIQLVLSILVVFALFLASCTPASPTAGPQAPEAPAEEEPVVEPTKAPPSGAIEAAKDTPTPVPTVEASKYSEAPMLAEKVAAGELPPVEERLPVDVQVIEPVDGIGKYGGTWHNVSNDPGIGNIKMALYDPPVRWKADYTGYEPGLAKDWEWSDDGKTITFHLREGIKWSDGEPFTTKDLEFWWNDLANNPDYKKVSVPWWAFDSQGNPIVMEFPDDYTWVLKFDTAQWIMPYILAQGFWEWEPLMKPAHWLKQYHPAYTDGATYEDLDLLDRWTETPGYPCLMAWCLEEYVPGQTWTFTRNPYYWKIDTEGNQLPYIDELHVELVQELETRKLSVAQGKYDCTFRGVDDPTEIPFLTEQGKQYGYRLVPGWMNGAGGWPGLLINMDYHEDQEYDPATESAKSKEIRELIRTVEFRKGLSHAIDRQRVIDVVWDGIGEVQNFTISSQSWHFASPEGQEVLERWKNADVEYDPELTKQMWDSIGFVDANGDGWRDLPSGTPFDFVLDMNDWGGERVNTDFNEVLRQNLEDVGVKLIINNVIGTAEGGLRANYGVGWILRNTHPSEVDLWTYPDWVFPLRGSGEGSRAFPMQGYYYQTGGADGWKPEPGSPAEKLQALYRKGINEPDIQKRHEIVWEAIEVIIEEGPFTIGAAGDQPVPVVCKNNFKGVPEYGLLGPWAPGSPGNVHPEQFWFDN
ncbi:MAG: ABC transporter substrate-binding protein [Chloroflexi bacterium]|nr:ABC transporter substrate-binding protein [Chloroflexota bacterium]